MRKVNKKDINARVTPFSLWLRTAEAGSIFTLPLTAQRTNVIVSARAAGVEVDVHQAVLIEGTRSDPKAHPVYLVKITKVL